MARESTMSIPLPQDQQVKRNMKTKRGEQGPPIFVHKDGQPVQFYLLPRADLMQVRQFIERWGGTVLDNLPAPNQDCIVVSYHDDLSPSLLHSHPVVTVTYIVQSLEKQTLLPISSFLIKPTETKVESNIETNPNKKSPVKSSPVKNSPVKKSTPVKKSATPIKNKSPVKGSPLKKTLVEPSSPLIRSTASPYKQPPSSPVKQPQPVVEPHVGGDVDDMLLFRMVTAKLPKDEAGYVTSYDYQGHQIFREIYDSGRFPDQTITSLKQRYISYILPNLSTFINNTQTNIKKKSSKQEVELELEEEPMHLDSSFEFSTQAPNQTQAPHQTQAPYEKAQSYHQSVMNAIDFSVDSQERDIALYLAEHYDVTFEVAVYALYATSGVVRDAQLLLSNPAQNAHLAWHPVDDVAILNQRQGNRVPGYPQLLQAKGEEAVRKRLLFLESFIN